MGGSRVRLANTISRVSPGSTSLRESPSATPFPAAVTNYVFICWTRYAREWTPQGDKYVPPPIVSPQAVGAMVSLVQLGTLPRIRVADAGPR